MQWKITFKKVQTFTPDKHGIGYPDPEKTIEINGTGETIADAVHNAEAILAGSAPEGTTPDQWVARQMELCDEQVEQNPR